MDLLIDRVPSPLGTLLLVSDGEALRALDFDDHEPRMACLLERRYGRAVTLTPARDPGGAATLVGAYLEGGLAAVERIPVRTDGTAFQERVWAALRAIPAGETITYGTLAARLGQPTATRAVGLANGANPVAIVVPCHRVIGANRTLTGYGGGLERKRWLLDHERAALGPEGSGLLC
jgi:methylated-DNA-[protein]-cysteine S-methyltransferase